MKKTALIVAALAAAAMSLQAQEETAPSYSVTVDFPYVSKYVFRGVQLAEESFQPSVEVAVGDFYAGLWTNQPITSNIDNELDFYAGYGFAVSDTWSLDTGLTMYYYPELDSQAGGKRDTYEAYVGLSGEVGTFTPSFYAYYDFTLETLTLQGAVGYSIPLSDVASFDLSGTLGFVDPKNGESYAYWGIGASIPYQLTSNASVAVGAQYAANDLDNADDEHFFFSVGVTVGF